MAVRVEGVGREAVLVGEGAEGVGAEVDEGFHVLLCEAAGGDSALVVHGVVVVFVVGAAGFADGLVGHRVCGFALFLVRFCGFAGFRLAGFWLAFGQGALLAGLDGLDGALVGKLATLLALLAVHGALLFLLAVALLAEALLAWVLLFLFLLSIAVLLLLAILVFALRLLVIALVFLLAVTLDLTLLAVIILAGLLTVLLLATILRHSFGKLRLEDQVTG